MAWVRFTANFDYHPRPRVTIAYKTGMALRVKRDCANQAIALGRAEEVPTPPRRQDMPNVDDAAPRRAAET